MLKSLHRNRLYGLALISQLVFACSNSSSDNRPEPVTLSGSVQKGPFVLGSTVNIAPLDNSLNSTGQVFTTQTIDDLGQFSVNFSAAGRVQLEGNGFYYNEITGKLSAAQLTLRALYEIQNSGTQNAYINLITHLCFQREKKLILDSGQTTAAAIRQAEDELRAGLGVGPASLTVGERGSDLSLLGGNSDGNAYLFAVSAVVTQAASDRAASTGASIDATLQELLNATALDLADDGQLGTQLRQAYRDAQPRVDAEAVVEALSARLTQLGSSSAVPDLTRVLDSDGDGVTNALDNCPYTANATQSPVADGLCRWSVQKTKVTLNNQLAALLPIDLNDGKAHSVLYASATPAFSIMINNGMGTLAAPVPITLATPSGGAPASGPGVLLAADMNGDGFGDLVRLSYTNWMAVYPGDGQGGFGPPKSINKMSPMTPDMVDGVNFVALNPFVIADFKKDGLLDVVGMLQGNTGFKLVLVAQGAGGTWGTPTIVGSSTVNHMAAGDLDNDGKADFVLIDSFLNGARIFVARGDGNGGFALANAASLPSQVQGSSVTIGDFNGDGKQDVLAAGVPTNGPQRTFLTYYCAGDGLGGLAAPVQTAIPLPDGVISAGNFMGTGQTSLLTSPMPDTLQLWSYRSGQFTAGPLRPFVHFASSYFVDMDRDGRADFVGGIATGSNNEVQISVALAR